MISIMHICISELYLIDAAADARIDYYFHGEIIRCIALVVVEEPFLISLHV